MEDLKKHEIYKKWNKRSEFDISELTEYLSAIIDKTPLNSPKPPPTQSMMHSSMGLQCFLSPGLYFMLPSTSSIARVI